ncbi:MAG: efflux RND transporter periplasmic adaptor subunit [Oceanospirillaceae bacterium]|nr:efflux RND transporter periplasmic adaptor subunit [Oceanospirillaceae bacterium]
MRLSPPLCLIALLLPISAASAAAYDCVIDPSKEVRIASPVRGILDQVLVDRGEKVARNQVIATLKSSVETATVELLKLRAENSALIEVEREQVALSAKSLQRAQRLLKTNAISQQQLDELATDHRIQQRELAQVQQNQRVTEMELARARAELELRTIRSPDDGIVAERALSGGEFVNEDAHILVLVKLDPLYVETFVPVDLYRSLSAGQSAIVEPVAPFEGRYPARIKVVDSVFDAASGTVGVRLEMANPDHLLPGGLRCRVTFGEGLAAASAAAGD